jgi:hypothetical protein
MSIIADQDFSLVWERTVRSKQADLPPGAAEYFLGLRFEEADRTRMDILAAKAREGSLTPAEQSELNNYMNLGWFLDLMKSKARLSLAQHSS